MCGVSLWLREVCMYRFFREKITTQLRDSVSTTVLINVYSTLVSVSGDERL